MKINNFEETTNENLTNQLTWDKFLQQQKSELLAIKTKTKSDSFISNETIALFEEHIKLLEKKYDKLDEAIYEERKNLENIIDYWTTATFTKNDLLKEKELLENKKISKSKNILLKILSFGCYDWNKKIEKILTKTKEKLNKAVEEEKKWKLEYKTVKSRRQNLVVQQNKLVKNDLTTVQDSLKLKTVISKANSPASQTGPASLISSVYKIPTA